MPRKRRQSELPGADALYADLIERQHGVCAICGAAPKTRRLHIDHDHRTGKVRGLLCQRCNRALPTWVTVEWLGKAARYLEPPQDANPHIAYLRNGWRPAPVDPAKLAK